MGKDVIYNFSKQLQKLHSGFRMMPDNKILKFSWQKALLSWKKQKYWLLKYIDIKFQKILQRKLQRIFQCI